MYACVLATSVNIESNQIIAKPREIEEVSLRRMV